MMRILATISFFFLTGFCMGQSKKGYAKDDLVPNFAVTQVLNLQSKTVKKLDELKKDIMILDFFGTWCAPCIKALPNLIKIGTQFQNNVSIVLVSNEEKEKLESFVSKRKPFPFPIVIDIENMISNGFMPPSYPYTVVIGRTGKILAFTEAVSITEEDMKTWMELNDHAYVPDTLKTSKKLPVEDTLLMKADATIDQPGKAESIENNAVKLSQDFIYGAKTGGDISTLLKKMDELPYDTLQIDLADDNAKKAFWINIYNGFTQYSLKKDGDQYKSRGTFFGKKQVYVAGKILSLDNIEHGILRHSKIKWSLGYFNKLFVNKTEKELRVTKLDCRIHFALNCGAKSCPPIAFYNPKEIDTQLDLATRAYLSGESKYDSVSNTIYLPAIMGWFRADFGNKKGMRKLLHKLNLIPSDKDPAIRFSKYDWTLYVNNYQN